MDNNVISPIDAEMASSVKFFLRNNSYKKCKKRIWKYYTAWAYFSEESAGSKEHSDMLFFYERLKEFLKELNELYNKDKLIETKSPNQNS